MSVACKKIDKFLDKYADGQITNFGYDNVLFSVSDSKCTYINRELLNLKLGDPSVVKFLLKGGWQTSEGVDFVMKTLASKLTDK